MYVLGAQGIQYMCICVQSARLYKFEDHGYNPCVTSPLAGTDSVMSPLPHANLCVDIGVEERVAIHSNNVLRLCHARPLRV